MLSHRYGTNVHLLHEPYMLSLLARLGAPDTSTSEAPRLVRAAYRRLAQMLLSREFPVVEDRVPTRMAASEPQGFYQGQRLCQHTRLVVCSVIRAGILPAQELYESATYVLPAANVRLDFLNMSRTVDAKGHVTGVRMDGSKVGGDVRDAIVVIPDPMGATGSTVADAVEFYKNLDGGPPKKIIAAHLITAPEAIQKLTGEHPGVKLYAGRLDRGLSSAAALDSVPGTFPDQERGLNDMQYIVPGAGGLGELLTNSWV